MSNHKYKIPATLKIMLKYLVEHHNHYVGGSFNARIQCYLDMGCGCHVSKHPEEFGMAISKNISSGTSQNYICHVYLN